MIDLAQKLLAFVFTLGVLITFHELGHYVVARLAGVKVLRFSIRLMPSAVAGSPSWEMMNRTACPSGDTNIFKPRLKSALSKTSGGR